MKGPAWVSLQPGAHLGVFMGGIIVEHGMDELFGGYLALDGIEKANELLVSMALYVATDHSAVEHVERREQASGAMPDIIMGHCATSPRLERQPRLQRPRLGAVKCLDLGFLVNRKHDRAGWRIEIEPDDIDEFIDEEGIARTLEGPQPVRLQLMGLPYSLHGSQRQAAGFGHRAACPVCHLVRRFAAGQRDNLGNGFCRRRRFAWRPRFIAQQRINTALREALLPTPDHRPANPDAGGNLRNWKPISGSQDDTSALSMLERRVSASGNLIQSSVIRGIDDDANCLGHPPDSHISHQM